MLGNEIKNVVKKTDSYNCENLNGLSNGLISLLFKGERGLNIPKLFAILDQCAKEDIVNTIILIFNLRDCRGGKGERELGRKAFVWLFVNYPEYFKQIFHYIPEYGRWDDLLEFFPDYINLDEKELLSKEYLCEPISDPKLKMLKTLQHEIIIFIGERLKKDVEEMKEGLPCSLCAKWSPTESSSLRKVAESYKKLAEVMNISHKKLRTEYLSPLRKYLQIVETFMCSGKWSKIEYNKIPSQALNNLRKAFEKNDKTRYTEWLNSLKKKNTFEREFLPDEIIKEVRLGRDREKYIEQWERLLSKTKNLGIFKDSVAVVDTSTSMNSNNFSYLDTAFSLGLLIAEESFENHIINFDIKPKFTIFPPQSSLEEKYNILKNMSWGGKLNLEGVFNLILQKTKKENCKMPKKIFIISDMCFDQIKKETDFQKINSLYEQFRYKKPKIIYWNLSTNCSEIPVLIDKEIVLVSGSNPLIKEAMFNLEEFNSLTLLNKILENPRYSDIKTNLIFYKDYTIISKEDLV